MEFITGLVAGTVFGVIWSYFLSTINFKDVLTNLPGMKQSIAKNAARCKKYKANPTAYKRCTGGVCLNCTSGPCPNGRGEPNTLAEMERCLYA